MSGERKDFSGDIEVTLSGTVTRGAMAKIQDMVGVYRKAGVSGDKVPFAIKGLVKCPKAAGTGLAWTKGQKLYYESSGGTLTTASTSNTYAGIAAEDATAAAATGWAILAHGVD